MGTYWILTTGYSLILNSSVNRRNNTQHHEIKYNISYVVLTTRVDHAMMFIARCASFFAVLQKKKQQRTLNTV